MSVENFLVALIGAVIGIIATVIVGRYYFIKSTNKRLSTYIHLASPVLADIDPAVREVLKVHYRTIEVLNLFQLQFLIANEGERPIRDCIEPLSLLIPQDVKVLDATILHVSPKERVVKINSQPSEEENSNSPTLVEFEFPLLNKGDYFLVKFLLDGLIDPLKLEFRITVDDLPPIIKPQILPFSLEASDGRRIEWPALFSGVLFLVISLSSAFSAFILYQAKQELRFMFPQSIATLIIFSLILFCASGAIFLFFASLGILGVGIRGRSRFYIPPNMAAYSLPMIYKQARITTRALLKMDVTETEVKK